jgi:hypothetical protein
MKEYLFVIVLLFCFQSVCGQKNKDIHIDASRYKTFELSEITENMIPVSLEDSDITFDYIDNVLWTDEYLFISVHSVEFNQKTPTRVLQYNSNGKFLREIGEQSSHTGTIMCDTDKKELYVLNKQDVFCYDFSGTLKQVIKLKDRVLFYYKNNFWMQAWTPNKDIGRHKISNYNLLTNETNDIFFDIKDNSALGDAFIGRTPCFSTYNNMITIAFGLDYAIYRIQGQKLVPIIKYDITPEPKVQMDKYGYVFQGFIGKYLLLYYCRNWQKYLYIQDLKTGKTYNVKFEQDNGIKDDIMGTGFCDINPLNKEGYFYFIKKNNDEKHAENLFNVYIARIMQ